MVVVGKSAGEGVVVEVAAVLVSASSSVSASGIEGDVCREAAITAALAAEYRHRHGG